MRHMAELAHWSHLVLLKTGSRRRRILTDWKVAWQPNRFKQDSVTEKTGRQKKKTPLYNGKWSGCNRMKAFPFLLKCTWCDELPSIRLCDNVFFYFAIATQNSHALFSFIQETVFLHVAADTFPALNMSEQCYECLMHPCKVDRVLIIWADRADVSFYVSISGLSSKALKTS